MIFGILVRLACLTNFTFYVICVVFIYVICVVFKTESVIIMQRTRVTDIVQYVTSMEWKWAGHITQMKDTNGLLEAQSGR